MSLVSRVVGWIRGLVQSDRSRRRLAFIDLESLSGTALHRSILDICFDPETVQHLCVRDFDLQAQVIGVGTGRDYKISMSVHHASLEQPIQTDEIIRLVQTRIVQRLVEFHQGKLFVSPDDIDIRLSSGKYELVMD